jgi:hypothetical protein
MIAGWPSAAGESPPATGVENGLPWIKQRFLRVPEHFMSEHFIACDPGDDQTVF